MTQVFLNYRADDDPFGVAFLDEKLSNRFGSDTVFLASKSIPAGAHWEETMFQAVADSTAVLVIIGRGWLAAKHRLEQEDDFVRREILAAFELGKRVIPVRLGVPRLSESDLPPELAPLAKKQDIEIRFRSSKIDVDGLAAELLRLVPELPDPPAPAPSRIPHRWLLGGASLGLVAAVAFAFVSCGGPDENPTQSISVSGNGNDVDQNSGAHNEASSGACAQFGDNNTCVVQLQADAAKASAAAPTDEQFKADIANKSTSKPTEPGPWPYLIVDTVEHGINEGLWARTTNELKGDRLGVTLNRGIIWADCVATSDYSPLPEGDANNVGPRWLSVRWNLTDRTKHSNPSDTGHAWMYLGYTIPMYHNGDIPECSA